MVPGTPGAELYGTGLTVVADGAGVSVWVRATGQTVVYKETIFVVTCPRGQSVTLGAQLVIVYTEVAYTVDVVIGVAMEVGTGDEADPKAELWVSAAVTGQTVVETAMVSVVTDPTGQLVTVGAQLVIVYTDVAYTVDVVIDVVGTGDEADEDVADPKAEDSVSVAVTGQTVVEIATVLVVTDPTGQSVTVGAQLVMVYTEVA